MSSVDQEVEPRAVRWSGPVVPEQADIQDHTGPLMAVQPIIMSFPAAASAHPLFAKELMRKVMQLQAYVEDFRAPVGYEIRRVDANVMCLCCRAILGQGRAAKRACVYM